MSTYSVSVDISRIIDANEYLRDELLANVGDAVRMVADKVQEEWQHAVDTAPGIWIRERREYAASIQLRMVTPTSAEIWTEYRYAEEIETGRPAKDLKRMLDTSPKVRETKDGRRYLIIPFRHNVSELKSAGMYRQAHGLDPSMVTKNFARPARIPFSDISSPMIREMRTTHSRKHYNFLMSERERYGRSQFLIPAREYKWGKNGRLMGDDVPKNMQGLVRMDTTAGGKVRNSAYLTFRNMMEGSPGWIIPPRPGLHILSDVAGNAQTKLEFAIGEAVKGVGSVK